MRDRYNIILLLFFLALGARSAAQLTPDKIHGEDIVGHQQPIPYLNARPSDIVWCTMIWKTIDLNEDFNQYIYFPLDQDDRSGKKSLAYVIWEAMERNEIPIYEDDELKVPIDNQWFIESYTKADTIQLEIGYDEDDNEIYQTVIVPKHFDGADIYQYYLREAWFIDKQANRQESRRMALAPTKDIYITLKTTHEDIYMGHAALFWVPMQDPSVRNVLARHMAYIDDQNLVAQPSWDYVFVHQYYSAYITRERNRYNRSISHYATGQDAIIESARIVEKVNSIGDDMWEY